MKSLDQIEPRRCLNDLPGDADAVHVVSEPGQYFVSGNILAPAGKSGIRCVLPPGVDGTVSIDMSGFEIVGQQGSLHGVSVQGQQGGALEISNGRITGMGGDGVRAGALEALGVDGVFISDCAGDGVHGVQCRDVTLTWYKRDGQRRRGIADCGGNGVLLTDCGAVRIAELSVSQCTLSGMDVECDSVELLGVTATANGGSGLKVKEKANRTKCSAHRIIASGNGGGGFEFVDDGTLGPGDSEVVIEDASISSNQADGVSVKPIRVELKRVSASGNGGDGIDAECDSLTMVDCTTDSNLECGVEGVARKNLTINLRLHASGNGAEGADLTCSTATISGVTAVDNSGSGIKVRKGGVVTGTVIINHCSALRNGVDGLDLESDAVRITDCTANDNLQCGVIGQKAKSWMVNNFEVNGNGASGLRVRKGGVVTGTVVVNSGNAMRNGADGLDIESDSVDLTGCITSDNSQNGARVVVDVGGVVRSFSHRASGNGGAGLHVPASGGVPGGRCTCDSGYFGSNTGDGIFLQSTTGGEIKDCTFSGNAGAGLNILGTGHVVHRNTFISSFGGPVLAPVPGNSVGPLVDETGIASNCNPSANQVR